MGTRDGRFSKRDIARAAGVRPPAVNNWERRYANFPRPVDQQGRYAIDEVVHWLASRVIPASALLPGEPTGTTYGERFARNVGLTPPTKNIGWSEAPGSGFQREADPEWTPSPTLWQELEKRRGAADLEAFEALTLTLLHLRHHDRVRWAELVQTARQASPGDFVRELVSALTMHRRRYPVVHEVLQGVRLLNLWTAAQLVEISNIINGACVGEGREMSPTAARVSATCRFLLDRCATSDGARGGEFATPEHLVRLMVRLLAPEPEDRVYDPACGNGSFLVGAAAHVEMHGGASQMLSFGAQALTERSLRLAKLNLDIHGLTTVTELRRINPLRDDPHRGRRFDVVFANPPFNMSGWSRGDPADDARWRYGPPPRQNANFAWLQHIAEKLSPRGRAAVLMPNSAAVSANFQERAIRKAMVDAGVVDCVVMLPAQLFRSTAVPVTLWLLRNRPLQEADRVLFIDARSLGARVERAHRILRDEDIGRIVDEYREWRRLGAAYPGIAGFSVTATKADITACDYALAASRYVAVPPSLDPEAEQKVRRLRESLTTLHAQAAEVDAIVERELNEVFR